MVNWRCVVEVVGKNLVLVAIALYFIAPMTWLIVSAFREQPGTSVEFRDFTLQNFPQVLGPDTLRWIRNSMVIGGGTTLLTTITALLAAYPFARYEFRGKTFILFVLVMSMTIPLSGVMLPMFSLARWLGLANTLAGVILVLAARQIPMAIWVLKEFIGNIPVELEEAAWVDGASTWDTLVRIVLPLTGPGLAVVGLMSFVAGWGDFTVSLILLNSEELFPISMGIYKASITAQSWGYVTVNYGLMAAIALVYLIPPVMVFLVAQKHLVRGMMIGAVKG